MRDEYSSGVNANVDDERDRHLNMGGGLVPYDTKPSDNQAPEPLRFGVFWCLAAGAVAGYIPVLASFAGAYGTCLCTYQKGWKRILAALISLLAPSVAIALLVPSLRVGTDAGWVCLRAAHRKKASQWEHRCTDQCGGCRNAHWK